MNLHDFLEKLRALPENQKKIILWMIVAVLAIIMGFFWVNSAIKNFSKISESVGSIELPNLSETTSPSQ